LTLFLYDAINVALKKKDVLKFSQRF